MIGEFVTETVASGSIPDLVKSKATKIGMYRITA